MGHDLNPALRVYVHEKGAPHLVDPAKLLQSATRLYGDQMDRLWGVVRPVPAAAIRSLQGGERLRFEFERTESRLLEMQSHEYLARAHRA